MKGKKFVLYQFNAPLALARVWLAFRTRFLINPSEMFPVAFVRCRRRERRIGKRHRRKHETVSSRRAGTKNKALSTDARSCAASESMKWLHIAVLARKLSSRPCPCDIERTLPALLDCISLQSCTRGSG